MNNALVVSSGEKSATFFTEILNQFGIRQITVLSAGGEARRRLLERDYDLAIINSPLKDEQGWTLSKHISSKGFTQVILAVKAEFFEEAVASCEEDGVLVISKPVNKTVFRGALSFAKSALVRFKRVSEENAKLTQKIEDIKIVDRAKRILISHMNMSEQEAHRYIEKQAMDARSTRREIAAGILRTYEN